MYPSKGNAAYGQQSYAGQQAYGQIPGAGDVGAQHAMASRQSMMGAAQEADMSGYRTHSAQGVQYGGPYAAVYSSAALSSTHQVGGVGGKGGPSSGIHGQYTSALPESSKFLSGALGSNLGMKSDDYVSATSRGYSQKGDPFSAVKSSDYSSTDRRHYGDQAAYLGRELQNDPARRFADSVAISQHHADLHDRMDQATLLREQQILRAAQSLQSGSDIRQADYLAARAAPIHRGSQEFSSYGGRMDVDPRSLPILGSTPYDNQHASSILGGAIRRNVDELYTQGSSGTTYGVGLPPGRDYVAGKGLHVPSLESDYQGLSRAHSSLGVSVADERKDDRSTYRRELERDEEHRRELIRAKEKDREREEREREERERERERVRERERRDRERERDRRRSSDARRERTPPRSTKDLPRRVTPRRASPRRSSPHRASPRRASPRRASPRRASPRRVSPRREAVHRHRSPVKEKKREYACKIYPFSLVEAERDYLSLNKRYPRLFISAECSKVVLHWSKQNLHLSLHTPVSFEHEYVEVDIKGEKALIPSGDLSSLKHGNTVWNAKVILMSGMTADALNDMGSYKSSDDKIIHFNNIIRFAIIKKDHSFMAIGGPWNATVDGGDPSVDDLSLIQTARRYLRDTTGLDLQNCRHWNRFLEIHYDRIGEDGLFSHKEITVLFVPDLSESLPSLDTWRTQWLVHKKAVLERERFLAAKDKRSREKKESEQDKVKAEGSAGKGIKVSETDSGSKTDAEKADDKKGATKESNKENAADEKGKGPLIDESMENLNGAGNAVKTDGMKGTDGTSSDLTMDTKKTVKKKIVKKVVKTKVSAKKANEASVEAAATLDEKVDAKDEGEQIEQANVVKDEDTAEPVNVKTVARKKIVKKALAPQKADYIVDTSSNQIEEKPDIKRENQDEKLINKEPDDASTPQGTAVKTTGKKKIIRRVIKKKATGSKENNVNAIKKEPVEEGNNVALQEASKGEAKDQVAKKDESKAVSVEKASTIEKKAKTEKESKKEDRTNDLKSKLEKGDSKVKAELEAAKDTDVKKDVNGGKKEKPKDEKEKKSKDGKHDSEEKSHKEKEKGKSEDPPQHPGLFLQTKRSKESKIRSMSLSLDGLLDYNDKDTEESTFELSVFAESFNEMLQYQMACRLLSFLQKLRRRYVLKKNQRKRQRDEKSEKENEESSLLKRKKSNDSAAQNESSKSGQEDTSNQIREETMGEGETVENKSDDVNEPVEEEEENNSDDDNSGEDEEEDPEETPEDDPEENDQEMKDVAVAGVQKDDIASKSDDLKAEPEKSTAVDDSGKETVKELSSNKTKPKAEKSDGEKGDDKPSESVKSESSKDVVYDKELLQAFRYFDYNRVGYIKVEDLRCLLHDLGMFLSHRDVKELVQCALFESNSARDNRIFYRKLVKLTDI